MHIALYVRYIRYRWRGARYRRDSCASAGALLRCFSEQPASVAACCFACMYGHVTYRCMYVGVWNECVVVCMYV